MVNSASIANALARLFLLPGDIACNAMGLAGMEYRDLVRMLINSLFWTLVGVVGVALTV